MPLSASRAPFSSTLKRAFLQTPENYLEQEREPPSHMEQSQPDLHGPEHTLTPTSSLDFALAIKPSPEQATTSTAKLNTRAGLPVQTRISKRPSRAKRAAKVSQEEAQRLAAVMDRPPTRRSAKGGWTDEEDDLLRIIVTEHNERNWKNIAAALNTRFCSTHPRNDVQCLHRWQKVLQPGLKKGPWTEDEDQKIARLVAEVGANKWSHIAKHLPGRIGKQCRERWFNHLNPDISKLPWSAQEEATLQDAHSRIGNKWAIIARYLPLRTTSMRLGDELRRGKRKSLRGRVHFLRFRDEEGGSP
jgi:Myb-like DNA-binding domain